MGRDTIQLESVVSTISKEYLREFTSEYYIPESLHPELPGPEETIVDFPEGKVGVYTKFFEFANFCIPISQFLFDILGHFQIHLSQLSVIGAAKVSHFEINCRILNIIPTLNLFRIFYVLSYNSGWMSFSKRSGKNTPQCYTKPLDSLKNWNNRFFWVDERIFPTVMEWRSSAPKDQMPSADSYSAADVAMLNTHRTPIQKQSEDLLCLVGLSWNYFSGDDEYPTFLYDDDREMDLFGLISAPNPTKVKTRVRPRASYKVPLLTATASHVVNMEDTPAVSVSSETPFAMEKSLMDFSNEDSPPMITGRGETEDQVPAAVSQEAPTKNAATAEVVPEQNLEKEATAMGGPETLSDAKSESDPDPLSYAKPQPHPERDVAQKSAPEIPTKKIDTTEMQDRFSVESPGSGKSTSVPFVDGSPGGIYQPGWGVTNNCRLDTPDACQDVVDHIAPLGYFSELRHLPNSDFLSQYNMNLAWKVAMGSQLRLRFEQEVRLLKKATAKIAIRDQRIQAREEEIKRLDEEIKSLRTMETEAYGLRNRTQNLETLLEAEVDMKKAAEAKNVELAKELESLRVQFSDLQVNNNQLSEQVSNLQAQVTGKEKIKAAFEEFKKYEDDRVEQRCAEMDARLDALSIDFDEELYPHMLTAIACRRWVIGHGLRLAIMKCAESKELRQVFVDVVSAGIAKGMSEGLKHGVDHGKANLDLAAIEAYGPEANDKYVAALQALKDLKYPLVDELEKLKDAPLDLIMASLYLESDTGEDAPQWIRELRPAFPSSKYLYIRRHATLKIPGPLKGKCCWKTPSRLTSDVVPVSVPTAAPQGLTILLADAAIRTEDEASPRLLRFKSLPPIYNLDWP
ncbi:hypothetical protein Tco_1404523 [Tanacetum coccineum]